MPETDSLARALRAAVLAGDHTKAMRLAVQYTEAVRTSWMLLDAPAREASQLPRQSVELLNWVREMTLMHRGMTGEHLKMLAKATRYQTARALYLQSSALAER